MLITAIVCGIIGFRLARDRTRRAIALAVGQRKQKVTADFKKLGAVVGFSGNGEVVELSWTANSPTDSDLARLSGLTTLRTLRLHGGKYTDQGLSYLKGLRNLEVLVLSEGSVTDTGLGHLGRPERLRYLNLLGTQVTTAAVRDLRGLPNLEWIVLADARVTDDERAELEELFPRCHICP